MNHEIKKIKIGQCHICGEGIFSDEEIWQSEKGDLYYCNKCVEEAARKRFKRQEEIKEAIKKYKEYIDQKIKKQLEANQYVCIRLLSNGTRVFESDRILHRVWKRNIFR